MREQGIFCDVCTQRKKTGSRQRRWWCSERIVLRNLGVSRGLRYEMNVHKQTKSNKTNNGAKKNENEQAQICVAI